MTKSILGTGCPHVEQVLLRGYQRFTTPTVLVPLRRLIYEWTPEFAEAHSRNRADQLVIFKQAHHVQILDDSEPVDTIGSLSVGARH